MPRGDGSGPAGLGPMTGRGVGFCAGYPEPGFTRPGPGRGGGWGMGRGGGGWGRRYARGWRQGFYGPAAPWTGAAPLSDAEEADMLKQQAETLARTQADIKERIKALESRGNPEDEA